MLFEKPFMNSLNMPNHYRTVLKNPNTYIQMMVTASNSILGMWGKGPTWYNLLVGFLPRCKLGLTKREISRETVKFWLEMVTSIDTVNDYWIIMVSQRDRHIREVWRGKRRFDGSSIDGQDGHNDTGQKKWGKLVHIAYADEYHQNHEDQESCAIDTHVI